VKLPSVPQAAVGPGLLLAALVLLAVPAAAHPVPFSYLDLRLNAGAGQAISGTLTVHVFDAAHELGVDPPEKLLEPGVAAGRAGTLESLLGSRLTLAADGRPLDVAWGPIEVLTDKQSLRLPFVVSSHASEGAAYVRSTVAPGRVNLSAALFPYDPNHQTFVNVYDAGSLRRQAILDVHHATLEYFSGSTQGTLAVIARFVPAGIQHILIGPDHILFLIGLLLLGGSVRRLLVVVTSFTLAHSITLSIAALNLLSPPSRVVEPLIALSIVYVGCDNLMIRGGRDVRAWIAFAFGLVHGFGFASVLREMDLPQRALGWSLFSFNVGVEIGQLMVVVVVASALAALRHRSEAAGRRLAFAGSIVVVLAGTFWFVQRVFFVGGNV
jgi:hydrogenase/urease accessory protein HupE